MANPFLGVRIPPDLHKALMARANTTGQTKSDIVIDALRIYLGMTPEPKKIEDLEARLSVLEQKLEHLSHE